MFFTKAKATHVSRRNVSHRPRNQSERGSLTPRSHRKDVQSAKQQFPDANCRLVANSERRNVEPLFSSIWQFRNGKIQCTRANPRGIDRRPSFVEGANAKRFPAASHKETTDRTTDPVKGKSARMVRRVRSIPRCIHRIFVPRCARGGVCGTVRWFADRRTDREREREGGRGPKRDGCEKSLRYSSKN